MKHVSNLIPLVAATKVSANGTKNLQKSNKGFNKALCSILNKQNVNQEKTQKNTDESVRRLNQSGLVRNESEPAIVAMFKPLNKSGNTLSSNDKVSMTSKEAEAKTSAEALKILPMSTDQLQEIQDVSQELLLLLDLVQFLVVYGNEAISTDADKLSEGNGLVLEANELVAEGVGLASVEDLVAEGISVVSNNNELLSEVVALVSENGGLTDVAEQMDLGSPVINTVTDVWTVQINNSDELLAVMNQIASLYVAMGNDSPESGVQSVNDLLVQLRTIVDQVVATSASMDKDDKQSIINQFGQVLTLVTETVNDDVQKLASKIGDMVLVKDLSGIAQVVKKLIQILATRENEVQTVSLGLDYPQDLHGLVGVLQRKIEKMIEQINSQVHTRTVAEDFVPKEAPSISLEVKTSAQEPVVKVITADGLEQKVELTDDETSGQAGQRGDSQDKPKEMSQQKSDSQQRELFIPVKVQRDDANFLQPPTLPHDLTNRTFKVITPTLSPETRERVWEQVVEKAQLVVAGKNSDMVINLRPEHLGKVSLHVSLENGVLTAKFAAQSQQVKEVIESQINNLKQNLTSQGFKVDQVTVHVGSEGGQPHWQRRHVPVPSRKSQKQANDILGKFEELEQVVDQIKYGRNHKTDGGVEYVV